MSLLHELNAFGGKSLAGHLDALVLAVVLSQGLEATLADREMSATNVVLSEVTQASVLLLRFAKGVPKG